jgi:hypothetical protein
MFILICNKIGWHNAKWISDLVKNPYGIIQNSFFGWNLVILSLLYLVVTIKDSWDIEKMKKDFREWIFG